VIVDNEGEKFLTTCESCDKEVYLLARGSDDLRGVQVRQEETKNKKAQVLGEVMKAQRLRQVG